MSWWMLGAQALGTFAQMQGQQAANQTNIDVARENREWQAWMSNSAHQRAVTDLKAAGLNPILAAGNAASTPQGSTAQVQNTMEGMGNSALQAVQTQLAIDRQKEELKLLKSQSSKTDMETQHIMKSLPEASAKATYWEAVDAYIRSRPKTQKEILKQDKKFKSGRTNPLE